MGKRRTISMVKLKDVAKHANVSLTAASLILNDKGARFPKETRNRVINAAGKLGWSKNMLSQGIRQGKTQSVGVLIPPADSYWCDVLLGVHEELLNANYLPITLWTDACQDSPQNISNSGLQQIRHLIGRRVDGIILRPFAAVAYYEHFREFMKHVPVVVIDHEIASQGDFADSIETNEEYAAESVVKYLSALGHKRVAYLCEPAYSRIAFSVRRKKYFEFFAQQKGCMQAKIFEVSMLSGTDVMKTRMAEVFRDGFNPTAIYTETDSMAQLVYEIAKELGIRIPEDMSVVGFADLDFAANMHPPLTTVRQKGKEVGCQAARVILDRIKGVLEGRESIAVRIGCELVVRQSATRPKKTDSMNG